MSSSAILRHEEPAAPKVPPAQEHPPVVAPIERPRAFAALAGRWYRLNRGRLRAAAIGALSLIAFLIASHLAAEWELENVVVKSTFRRKGAGTALLNELLIRARAAKSESVFLEVRESNQAARALYLKSGFEQKGRRQGYYSNPPEDAILYRRSLP